MAHASHKGLGIKCTGFCCSFPWDRNKFPASLCVSGSIQEIHNNRTPCLGARQFVSHEGKILLLSPFCQLFSKPFSIFPAFSLIIKWAKPLSVNRLHIDNGLSMARKGLRRTVLDSSGNSELLNITQNRLIHACLAEAETVSSCLQI